MFRRICKVIQKDYNAYIVDVCKLHEPHGSLFMTILCGACIIFRNEKNEFSVSKYGDKVVALSIKAIGNKVSKTFNINENTTFEDVVKFIKSYFSCSD